MSNERPFVPLNITVLTVSDTRSEADDKSGGVLVDRIAAAVRPARPARVGGDALEHVDRARKRGAVAAQGDR